ncbi:MAG: chromate efflux transporter [Opitutaceae bacterium]|nr:chromate efflux transporter [Opitutaceae bacterium]
MDITLSSIFCTFLKLGCFSFGGPIAHIGYFREEFVVRKGWLDEGEYADLVALCQFLPGPASSQVGFSIGLLKGGFWGGVAAWIAFTLPSAFLMIGFAYGISWLGDAGAMGWLNGLKAAAVAVVAHAVWGMGRQHCRDGWGMAVALLVAGFLIYASASVYGQVAGILFGGLVGLILYRSKITEEKKPTEERMLHPFWGGASVGLFALLLCGLPLLVLVYPNMWVQVFDAFYRSGALVFGGGHVVLPLLQAEVVPTGWVSNDSFLAGYGAAQAVPGPLFTFSAYLGTVMEGDAKGVLGGLWCLLAIFLPALLLTAGVIPFWHRLRAIKWVRAFLLGANAAVVGLLLAALYRPVILSGISGWTSLGIALGALCLLAFAKTRSWLVVVLAAIAGGLLL